jgi:sugar phosphate isomerase/epimerase
VLALSTSWIADRLSSPQELVQALKTAGVAAVELDYRLTPARFKGLKAPLVEAGIAVSSLHNYCPNPGVIPRARPSGDYFRLSSPNPDERKLAVQWTANTIQNAHDMEAGWVVLHCGAIPGENNRMLVDIFNQYGRNSEELGGRLSLAVEQRQHAVDPFIEALLFSLDRLLPMAERHGVTLALENRFHFHELPGYEDLERVLRRFEGAPLGYWHDTGHAHALEVLGVASQEEWLKRYAPHLQGFHLHDAQGLEDHLPPGDGEIDWSGVHSYLRPDRPLVLELEPGTALSRVCGAADFVRRLLSTKK